MKKDKLSKQVYDDPVYEQAEINANKFNLIFTLALINVDFLVFVSSIFKLFTIELNIIIPISAISFVLFTIKDEFIEIANSKI